MQVMGECCLRYIDVYVHSKKELLRWEILWRSPGAIDA